MPALIVFAEPVPAVAVSGIEALCASGESVLVLAPLAGGAAWSGAEIVSSAAETDAAWERGEMACAPLAEGAGPRSVPDWLAADDFDRILLFSYSAPEDAECNQDSGGRDGGAAESRRRESGEPDASLLRQLFAAGAESVDWLPISAADKLTQSWSSGRRVGFRFQRAGAAPPS